MTPATWVSVDEIIVPFSGRSIYSVKIPNKPIPEGFKIWGLGFVGYYYDWLTYSPKTGTEGNKGKAQKKFPRKGTPNIAELADTV